MPPEFSLTTTPCNQSGTNQSLPYSDPEQAFRLGVEICSCSAPLPTSGTPAPQTTLRFVPGHPSLFGEQRRLSANALLN